MVPGTKAQQDEAIAALKKALLDRRVKLHREGQFTDRELEIAGAKIKGRRK